MRKLASLFVLVVLLAQTASAASYPVEIPFGRSWPYSIVVDTGRGVAYVDAGSGDYPPTGFLFGVINVTTHSVVKTLPLDEVPGPMSLDEATGDVYVAGNNSVEVFRGAGGTNIIGTSGHQVLRMAHDGNVSPYIFFTSGDKVFALNPQTSEVVRNVTVGNGPYGLIVDPATGTLFVSEYLAGDIAVLRASDLSAVATITLPSCCASEMALNTKTNTIYASTRTGFVDVIDARAEQFVKAVQVAPSAQNSTNAIAVDDLTGRVYVASSPGGSIIELASGGAVVGEFKVQSQVAGLAVDAKSGELYATNYHQITVFDASGARGYFKVALLGGAAIVASAVGVYFLLKRRNDAERAKTQSGNLARVGSGA